MTAARFVACIFAGLTCAHIDHALGHEMYVTNEKDNTISVIDTQSLRVLRTIPVGKRPRGITFSRDYSRFFVCASDSDAVQVFEAASGRHLYDLPSGADPEQFALAPDGKHLYIANEDNAVTTVIDVGSRQVVAQIDVGVEPEGMAVSPDSSLAVTTSETTNMAHFFNASTYEPISNVLVDQRPRHAEFTADGKKVWISSEIGGTISIIDVASKSVVHKIAFQIPGVPSEKIQPVGIVFLRDGNTAFVALGPANRVAVIDVKTATVVKYILVGERVWHLALTPENDLLFTTNGLTNDVSVIDVKTLKAVKSIKVGRDPWGVALRAMTPLAGVVKNSLD
jgi:PQQ-dependent catabolism-associated beta-propeller protein